MDSDIVNTKNIKSCSLPIDYQCFMQIYQNC
jgi:hypothetical protein